MSGSVPSKDQMETLFSTADQLSPSLPTPMLDMCTDEDGKLHPPCGLTPIMWNNPSIMAQQKGILFVQESCMTKALSGGVIGEWKASMRSLLLVAS